MSVRVKICGVTRPEDALTATALGADMIGLNFYPGSRRFVDADTAREVADVSRSLRPTWTIYQIQQSIQAATVEKNFPSSNYDKSFRDINSLDDTWEWIEEVHQWHIRIFSFFSNETLSGLPDRYY